MPTQEQIQAAINVMNDHGIDFRAPWECTLDDREQERFEALRAAIKAALSSDAAQSPGDTLTPAQGSAEHICSDIQCPYDGKPSVTSCKCHKTGEQMMRERLAYLEAKLALAAPVAPAAGGVEPVARTGDLTKLAAECHRAKWQFDISDEHKLTVREARAFLSRAFQVLHQIGDMALTMREAAKANSPAGSADGELLPVNVVQAASDKNGGLVRLPSGRELLLSKSDAAALISGQASEDVDQAGARALVLENAKLRNELSQARISVERLKIPSRDCYHIEACPHWVEACLRYQRAEKAITEYLDVFDRCGGSESVGADEFAKARDGLRSALPSTESA